MLTREEAEKELEPARNATTTGQLLRKGVLSKVDRHQRTLVRLLEGEQQPPEAVPTLAAHLDDLAPARRRRFLSVLAPGIADELARSWEWGRAAPYQRGWARRPFRHPDPAASRLRRLDDLVEGLRLATTYPGKDLAWFAAWAPHLGWPGRAIGRLLASETSHGERRWRGHLEDHVAGRVRTGGMGDHVVTGLLLADDPEGWEYVEQLLLKAQRQEGLRQSILEAVDFAHPDAFRRMLDVIVEHDLTRFAATVRAADVWFGESMGVRQDKQLRHHLRTLAGFLDEPPAHVTGMSGPECYLALWAAAFTDASAAVDRAAHVLAAGDPDQRLAAARLLAELDLPEARQALGPALTDDDPRVLAVGLRAWEALAWARHDETLGEPEAEALLRRLGTLARSSKVDTGLFAPAEVAVGPGQVADVLVKYADRSRPGAEARLAPAYAKATVDGRLVRVMRLAEDPVGNRQDLFVSLTDAAEYVRGLAARALDDVPEITPQEALLLEAALKRKARDLRRLALSFLSRQPAAAVRSSVERLAAGDEQQRAGSEALARAAGLASPTCADATPPAPARLADVLGLDHSLRTPSVRPRPAGDFRALHHPIRVLVTSLMAWLDEHKDVEVTLHHHYGGSEVMLLGDVRHLGDNAPDGTPPLAEIIDPWWERARPLLPGGGLELLLVAGLAPAAGGWSRRAVESVLGSLPRRFLDHRQAGLAPSIIGRLASRESDAAWVDPALDAVSTVLAALPERGFHAPRPVLEALGEKVTAYGWQQDPDPRLSLRGQLLGRLSGWFRDGTMDDEQAGRFWSLLRFLDEPLGRHDPRTDRLVASGSRAEAFGVPKHAPEALIPLQPARLAVEVPVLFAAHARGLATRHDVVDQLIRQDEAALAWHFRSHGIHEVTSRRPPTWFRDDARAVALVEEVCAAALEIEVHRDEPATTATHVVGQMRQAQGIPTLVGYLGALGKRPFVRGYTRTQHRDSSLCHVIRRVAPTPDETAAEFSAAVSAARIPERRLVELGVYAPQWAAYVEHALGWPGYEDGVWWLHAHTKGDDWSVDQELREEWEAEVARRTPLDATDLTRGAADVELFHRVIGVLGEDRFDQLLKAAKLASSAGGHKRAELFAQALLGRVDGSGLVDRISAKRHQDSVRALGLVPLAGPDDLLERYELLRGFVASDRTSGSQRRASESSAVDIGMENLARTAGYRDPQRLVWAMEAQAIADLKDGPLEAVDGDLTVALAIADGRPEISVHRGRKPLKSVPKASAKHPEIAALRARATTLRRQAGRMRASLEQACVAGETFSRDELAELYGHPLLRPMLADLVAVTAQGVPGFLGAEPNHLVDPGGARLDLAGPVRLAHPHDLLSSGAWPEFQHALFVAGRRQPFKQVFRELYTVTETERTDRGWSRRYAGHQVQPRQAAALLRSRGWVADFERGFTRTWHADKVTVGVTLLDGWGSPTEVEDATVELVWFHRAGTDAVMDLEEVPPRLFSETMRDLDLVVSVAHAGGFDPESSASTVEMRGRLVVESCDLLGLDNVETTDHHALVKGRLGTYSVNLGSGIVHRQPGNAVCIVPVHAQHRGRVFLPFVDDDPRTAEVISKVVLLARDDRIQDPTILGQLRG
ncbi:MAG TPA: DUF5724 domain-containing protein [Intrasporangium sp.]|nr:DUF5724 domain-containing protein [Intrasporangium sp.]